ncbi:MULTISPECIES: phage tail tape measure protein [unclassified Virgibacillus]|uniref:phage tail tape measure protein n=1 Tax=unclassified Virgibacillus TaxID=2620237 RepID=UPI00090B53AC|nr:MULTISPECIES: phage tail tape measure protein [unclassified Virgibacillus]API92721.1 phage tail tape measure protein [Virgibacillus sp. 6R]MBS7428217.1 phage tail tape measure protein [Virgibacillus sp. 19R1-5]
MTIGGTPVGNMVIKVDLDSTGVEKSMTGLQRQLKSSNKAMGAQLSAFDRGEKSSKKYGVMIEGLTNRHRIQARMVEESRKKYQRMSSEYGENSVKAQKASQELNEQIAKYQETGRELNKVSAEFKEFQRMQDMQSKGWYKVADGMVQTGTKMQAVGRQMTDFGKGYTMKVTTPIVAGGVAAFKMASDFESAFAGVRKTVDASEKEYKKLETGIRNMAKELPVAATDIAAVAESAGQLGIENKSILKFTKTVIDLGEATNMTREQAATEFARFANIVNMSQKDFDRLGASVVSLGNNMATTESEIMSMAMRLAAQGAQVGMTEAQIMALSATMSSLGIEAEAGGTAMTTVLKKIDKAVGDGGKSLQGFANAAGVSSSDFAKAWKKDPVTALDMFIKGLDKSSKEGKNLTTILSDLGIKGIREADTILRMAGASDLLSEAVDNSTTAWEENSALTKEAEQRYKTTESQMKILMNRIKDIGITLGAALIPAVLDAIEASEPFIKKIEDGAKAFSEMEKSQQQTILKLIALTAAVGPAAIGLGQVSMGIGGILKVSGNLTKTLGKAGGTGTLGAISGLSRAGVVGLAIAGVAGLSIGVYKLVQNAKKTEEANLDVAKSLNDQAIELDKSAETFDKLSSKAKISNEQLAELNDLNIRISQSSNPGEIAELQKQYDYLAKKSGLSKDELKKLFEANENIIDQTPDVKTNVSEQGNAFAKNTDAVNKYVESLYEMTRTELEGQLSAALSEKANTQQDINNKQKELNGLLDEMSIKNQASELSMKENKARQKEINELLQDRTIEADKAKLLQQELTALMDIENGDHAKAVEYLQKKINKKRESIEEDEQELAKIAALKQEMQNIILKQAGINAEGQKGLAQLDQSIVKNNEEILALEQKRQKNGELTTEEQKRYDKLVASNEKQQEAKLYIFEELGLYNNINSLLDTKLSKLTQTKQRKIEDLAKTAKIKVEEGNIVKQIQNKNDKLLETRNQLVKNLEKEGANKQEIRNQISALDTKIGKNDDVLVKILKEAGLWDQVKDEINLGSKALDNQGGKIDNNNKKTDEGIKREEKRTKEASKDVTKEVKVTDMRTIYDLNKRAMEMIKKPVKADDKGSIASLNKKAENPVTKVINFVGKGLSKLKFWAHGTPPSGHPGGHAVLGDGKGLNAGNELARLPNGKMFLSADRPTLYPNLPKGTHVLPARETKRILKSVPRYAQGTKDWQSLVEPSKLRNNEFMALLALNAKDSKTTVEVPTQTPSRNDKDYTKDLLDATLEQNNILMQILAKDNNVYLDSRSLGRGIEPTVTEIQKRNKRVRESFA